MTNSTNHIAIFGATGSVGSALCDIYLKDTDCVIHAFSRSAFTIQSDRVRPYSMDLMDANSIQNACHSIDSRISFKTVVVASGILHHDSLKPEKSYRQMNADSLNEYFQVNCIGPSLIAKYMIPKLIKKEKAVFAALSARVASISDNRLGGWYGYRSSKAALNMMIKTLAIESKRREPEHIIIGLHPGSVDSTMSKPFQSGTQYRFFTGEESASHLVQVIDSRTVDDSGKCFAWDGAEIPS